MKTSKLTLAFFDDVYGEAFTEVLLEIGEDDRELERLKWQADCDRLDGVLRDCRVA